MDKFLQMIGLARKAGFTVQGESGCLDAIKGHKAVLCVIAEDTSANTRKRLTDKCRSHGTVCIGYGTKESIGNCVGEENISAVCIKSESFAVQLKLLFKQEQSST
jgi:ribosomal protein L7Ae-like RNA K-turn-binding protein